MMRSHLEMETEEICAECEISPANVHTSIVSGKIAVTGLFKSKMVWRLNVKM